MILFIILIVASAFSYGAAMNLEAEEHQEMALILADINSRQSLKISALVDQLDEARVQWEDNFTEKVSADYEASKYERLYLEYEVRYNNLDRYFDEYLQYRPASTVTKSQIDLSPDVLILNRPGEYRLCNVAGTGSMRPIIEHGFVVLLEKTNEVQVGDIAVYEDKLGHEIIHRVIGEDGGYWIFRGDANLYDDPPMPKENVTWRVVAVFY